MNGHKFQSIKVQRVALVPHPCSDEPVLVYAGDEMEAIGCQVCGISLEEAQKSPCANEVKLVVVKDA